jgi:hypothetical protein
MGHISNQRLRRRTWKSASRNLVRGMASDQDVVEKNRDITRCRRGPQLTAEVAASELRRLDFADDPASNN